jgi:hypothetical protein
MNSAFKITVFGGERPGGGEFTDIETAAKALFRLQQDGSKTNAMVEVEGKQGHMDMWYGIKETGKIYTIADIQRQLKESIDWMTEK